MNPDSEPSATPLATRALESIHNLFLMKESSQDAVATELRLLRQAIERIPKPSLSEADRLAALRQKPMLTINETAELLGISRSSVENLITAKTRTAKPRLRTVREPGSRIVRITQTDLTAYIERLRGESR